MYMQFIGQLLRFVLKIIYQKPDVYYNCIAYSLKN